MANLTMGKLVHETVLKPFILERYMDLIAEVVYLLKNVALQI